MHCCPGNLGEWLWCDKDGSGAEEVHGYAPNPCMNQGAGAKSQMQIYHCLIFPVYGMYVSIHVFSCVGGCQRLASLIVSPFYALKEGLSLGLITDYVASLAAYLFQGS